MIALKKSFLIFELIDSINKFKRKKIIITYLDKIGARFINMEINVAKTVIENIEFFIKLFSQQLYKTYLPKGQPNAITVQKIKKKYKYSISKGMNSRKFNEKSIKFN